MSSEKTTERAMQILVVIRESAENHGLTLVKFLCPILELVGCTARTLRSTQLREILEGNVENWVTTTELEISDAPEAVMSLIEMFRDIMRLTVKKARVSATVEIFRVDGDSALTGGAG